MCGDGVRDADVLLRLALLGRARKADVQAVLAEGDVGAEVDRISVGQLQASGVADLCGVEVEVETLGKCEIIETRRIMAMYK